MDERLASAGVERHAADLEKAGGSLNALFVSGLVSVVAAMAIGGGLLQERSRWLPVALWILLVLVGVWASSPLGCARVTWSCFAAREQLTSVVLVGLPALVSLATLLGMRHKPTALRIAAAFSLGLLGAVAAPFVALGVACAVTGDCL